MNATTVTQEDFIAVMEDMREHAHNCVRKGKIAYYRPSKHVQATHAKYSVIPVSRDDAIDDAKNRVKEAAKPKVEDTADSSHTDITDITKKYQDTFPNNPDKAKNDFVTRMNKSREDAKKKSDDAIDAAYDKAIEEGKNLAPAQQNQIFAFMDSVINNGIMPVVSEIVDFVSGAIDKLTEWIKTAFDSIKHVFGKIVSFITDFF